MKKTKYLALVLVVAIALMGAGYAAWTDQINTTTTVQTGEFDVNLGTLFSRVWIQDVNGNETISQDPDHKIAPVLNGNTATFEFNNLYPGTRSFTQFYARNDGSITAKVQDVTLDYLTTMDVDSIRTIESELLVTGIIQKRSAAPGNTNLQNIGGFTDVKLVDLETTLLGIMKGVAIEPGDEVFFGSANSNGEAAAGFMYLEVPAALTGDLGENETVKIELQIDFIQYNLYDPAL